MSTRELRRIEHRLTAEDPDLAAILSAHGAAPQKSYLRWTRPARRLRQVAAFDRFRSKPEITDSTSTR
ncbi:hypothetical protein GCM10011609_25340 [Lentzea pudingi]|uniref:Uncharacterized protein n=1 Tax=Lentzea pudingi TaxID=1789439 RepID=A0ABQ2HQC3_9PSEU|nr:DUF3040 domain-containing protein [Lentzea pudingi]GGM87629.1 hypothetical protein GCM10011609_25340 [Lentzea pudingi]